MLQEARQKVDLGYYTGMQLVDKVLIAKITTHAPEVNTISTLSPRSRGVSLPFSRFTEVFLSSGYAAYVQSFIHLILAWSGNKWSA